MKKAILASAIIISILASFFYFGHSLWHPFLPGKKTVDEVIKYLEQNKILDDKILALANSKIDEIALICIKEDKVLELWVNNKLQKSYKLTKFSGTLGPKKMEGDKQIPEGLYKTSFLNPNSSYHLSIKMNYPNEWDSAWAKEEGRSKLGGDIFIHGKSASIGCIAIGDRNIEEVFYLVAKSGLLKCKVIIAPLDFRKNVAFEAKDSKVKELYEKIKQELRKYCV